MLLSFDGKRRYKDGRYTKSDLAGRSKNKVTRLNNYCDLCRLCRKKNKTIINDSFGDD